MELSIIAEAARWGGNNETPDTWHNKLNDIRDNFLPYRTEIVVNQLKNRGLYPSIDAVQFNQYGGTVGSNFQLTLTNPNGSGTIYYTIDGSDPRASGGDISNNALTYNGGINLPQGVVKVKARIKSGSNWSAMCPRTFYVNQNYSDLILSLIHI